jgi:hypothetical protein
MRQDHSDRKTFVVSAMTGHLVGSPWPYGRLHVSHEAITVRTIFTEKACPKSEIVDVSLQRLGPQNQLLFEDAAGEMADVAVVLAMRVKGVVGEQRRLRYPVVDRRPRVVRPAQGVVPRMTRATRRAANRLEPTRETELWLPAKRGQTADGTERTTPASAAARA